MNDEFISIQKAGNQMKNILAKAVLPLMIICLTTSVFASPFTITPVRIYMTPRDRAVAVTITNEGDSELVMQADVYAWKQKPDGEDDLVLTQDMLLSPPIIKLAGKSRQVVRLARLIPAPKDRQLTYRLKVREIPEANPSKTNVQLQIAIAFSLPVFITPPSAKSNLNCTADRIAADTVRATCENTGNAYAQPLDFSLSSPDGSQLASRDKGGYILPTIKRSFDIKSEGHKPIPGGKAKLTVRMDDGSKQTFDVMLAV